MKTCPYCRIKVGGNLEKCPLCQSKILGEGEDDKLLQGQKGAPWRLKSRRTYLKLISI